LRWPTATKSGLIRPSSVGPVPVNPEMLKVPAKKSMSVIEPTVRTFLAVAGEITVS
jgi:hypothetical protein